MEDEQEFGRFREEVRPDRMREIPPAHPDDLPAMAATLESYQDFFGFRDPRTVALGALLGVTLWHSGERRLGRKLLTRAVADALQHLAEDHPLRGRAWMTLSALLRQEGRHATAPWFATKKA
ncbi:MAG TPA: hypothetical protein VMB25_26260 [Bryobacteraceae bacterium]|nr:hypothetical protein [Bryobacteraceae bacterium]